MAVLDPQFVGALQAIPGAVSLLFLKIAVENRHETGSQSFALFSAGIFVYATGLAAGNFTRNYDLSVALWHLSLLGAQILAVSWFTLASQVTQKVTLTRQTVGVLVSYVVGMQLLVWTNWTHEFIYTHGKLRDGIVFETATLNGGFWLLFGTAYLLVTVATAMLILESVQSSGLRRRQAGTLSAGVFPTVVANAISVNGFGLGSHDVTVFGYMITALFFVIALYSGRFLDVVPVGRQTAVEEMNDAVVTLDNKNRVVDANRVALELFDIETGYRGLPAAEFFEPIPRETRIQFAGLVDIETEVTVTIDDEQRYFSVSVSPVGDNAANGRVFVLRDITKRKHREERLRRQNERLTALFENVSDAVVEYRQQSSEPIVMNVNDAFEEVFGYDAENLRERELDEFVVPPEKQSQAEKLNEQTSDGEQLKRELRRETADGKRTFLFRNAPFEIEDETRGYALYTDITEQKERERELQRQNERLDQFASVVSHDLRNPLNVAQLHIDLVRREHDTESAEKAEEALERMEIMIDELLTMARAETTVEEFERVDLAEAAATAWETVQTEDATLKTQAAESRTIDADPDLLQNVFENLFRNAIEHNDSAVTVTVGPLDEGFYVEDDGCGIPVAKHDQVFEHGYTTNDSGTGFGLSIVQEFVTSHGWDVTVSESTDGGARFEIEDEA